MYNVIVGFLYEAEQGMSIYWQQNTLYMYTSHNTTERPESSETTDSSSSVVLMAQGRT